MASSRSSYDTRPVLTSASTAPAASSTVPTPSSSAPLTAPPSSAPASSAEGAAAAPQASTAGAGGGGAGGGAGGGGAAAAAPRLPGAPAFTDAGGMAQPDADSDDVVYHHPWINKGSVSNAVTLCVMVAGLLLVTVADCDALWCKLVLSAGLFGFAGGITNWLAVTMLFHRVPGLYGSGVIQSRFKEIRTTVKNTMMTAFFDEHYLREYMKHHVPGLLQHLDLPALLTRQLEGDAVDTLLTAKISEEMANGNQLLAMACMAAGGPPGVVKHVKPLLLSFAGDMAKQLTQGLDVSQHVDVARVRLLLDSLMEEKLQYLTATKVKHLLEAVIRKHLGWLIIWGNVFGAVIGIVSQAVGFGL